MRPSDYFSCNKTAAGKTAKQIESRVLNKSGLEHGQIGGGRVGLIGTNGHQDSLPTPLMNDQVSYLAQSPNLDFHF